MRALRVAVVAAFLTAVTLFGFASPASAVCGGGGPGEPCYCPGQILKKTIIYC